MEIGKKALHKPQEKEAANKQPAREDRKRKRKMKNITGAAIKKPREETMEVTGRRS